MVAFLAPLVVRLIPVVRVPSPVLEIVAGVALAIGVGLALSAAGFTSAPLLVAIVLSATAPGLVVPVLKDAGQIESDTGQLLVAAASIADFGAVILLSLFFSGPMMSGIATGIGSTLLLLGGLVLVAPSTRLAVTSTPTVRSTAAGYRARTA
ncbi:MAG: cation:proton antiporter [Pseudonocardia sp.]|nr:cation:proton antiporter [Pseudonocardia sp.]